MGMFAKVSFACVTICAALFLSGCQGLVHNSGPFTLNVTVAGGGSGTVSSNPSAINCPTTCSATFQSGSQVALTATADTGFTFAGWSGACTGTGSCDVNANSGGSVTATFGASLQSVNHIVFMVQENRGLDHYFGALQQYRTQNGIPGTFDGLPQFNTPPGAAATNPGCDPAFPFQQSPAPFNDCVKVVNGVIDPNSPLGASQFTNKTIFEQLNDNNISWRIYVSDSGGSLQSHTELGMYTFANSHGSNFVSASQFMTDVQNGTLPAVAEVDPGFAAGTDEHAEQDDSHPGGKIQVGAQYVSNLINALMQSPSGKDTVFILTWDEVGGFYDNVPPQPAVSPDLMKPNDLQSGDICNDPSKTGPTCDFVYTGYRVPLIVVSPFSKKNYVSHTVADYTAILKFIEARFNVPSLTQRDAAQMDMTEFLDFVNAPWKTPPAPSNIPTQPTSAPCYMDHLP